jgi:ABC-type glucose/galactose transport system permease subunit
MEKAEQHENGMFLFQFLAPTALIVALGISSSLGILGYLNTSVVWLSLVVIVIAVWWSRMEKSAEEKAQMAKCARVLIILFVIAVGAMLVLADVCPMVVLPTTGSIAFLLLCLIIYGILFEETEPQSD